MHALQPMNLQYILKQYYTQFLFLPFWSIQWNSMCKNKTCNLQTFHTNEFFNLKSYITWKTSLTNIKSTAFPLISYYRGIYIWLTLWETCFFFLDFFLCFFFSLSSWSDSGWLRFFFSRSRSSWSESGMLLGDRERDSERVFFFFFDLCLEEDLTEAVSLSDSLPYKNQTEATMSDVLVHKAWKFHTTLSTAIWFIKISINVNIFKNPGWNKSPDLKTFFVGLGLYKLNGIGQVQ